MSKKLSDSLDTLSAETKSVEDNIAQANAESIAMVEAKIAEAKLNCKVQKAEFIELKNLSLEESVKTKIAQLQVNGVHEKTSVENTIEGVSIDYFEAKIATAEYLEACHHAESCVAFARFALADVEQAMLEAINSKLKLIDLMHKPEARPPSNIPVFNRMESVTAP